jgi:hypothetical protein
LPRATDQRLSALAASAVMAAAGWALWGIVCKLSGMNEAWNSYAYWALPVLLAALAMRLGYAVGKGQVLVGTSGTIGQAVGLFTWHPGDLRFWPFLVAAFAVLSVPSILAAWAGVVRRRRLNDQRAGTSPGSNLGGVCP